MSTQLIIDGNAVYEVDEECVRKKESGRKERMQRVRMQKEQRKERKDGADSE